MSGGSSPTSTPAQVAYDDSLIYPTVEHAYQAAKTLDLGQRLGIATLSTPGAAKHAGRQVTLRGDWEQVKERIMLDLLRIKFTTHVDLARKLVATGDRELIEGNTWGDRYWGKHKGEGLNRLGALLTRVRGEL